MSRFEKIQKFMEGGSVVQAQVDPSLSDAPTINTEVYSQAYALPDIKMPELDTKAIAGADANLIDKQTMLGEIATKQKYFKKKLRENPGFLESEEGMKLLSELQNLSMYGATQLKNSFERSKKQLEHIEKQGHGDTYWTKSGTFLSLDPDGNIVKLSAEDAYKTISDPESKSRVLTNNDVMIMREQRKDFDPFVEGVSSTTSLNTVSENILKKLTSIGYTESGGDQLYADLQKLSRRMEMDNVTDAMSYIKRGYKNKKNQAQLDSAERAIWGLMSSQDLNTLNEHAMKLASGIEGDKSFAEKMQLARQGIVLELINSKRITSNVESLSAHKGPQVSASGKKSNANPVLNMEVPIKTITSTVGGTLVTTARVYPDANTRFSHEDPTGREETILENTDMAKYGDLNSLQVEGVPVSEAEKQIANKSAVPTGDVTEKAIMVDAKGNMIDNLVPGDPSESYRRSLRLGSLLESVSMKHKAVEDATTEEESRAAKKEAVLAEKALADYKEEINFDPDQVFLASVLEWKMYVPYEANWIDDDVFNQDGGREIENPYEHNAYNKVAKNFVADEDGGYTAPSKIKLVNAKMLSTRSKMSVQAAKYYTVGATIEDYEIPENMKGEEQERRSYDSNSTIQINSDY